MDTRQGLVSDRPASSIVRKAGVSTRSNETARADRCLICEPTSSTRGTIPSLEVPIHDTSLPASHLVCPRCVRGGSPCGCPEDATAQHPVAGRRGFRPRTSGVTERNRSQRRISTGWPPPGCASPARYTTAPVCSAESVGLHDRACTRPPSGPTTIARIATTGIGSRPACEVMPDWMRDCGLLHAQHDRLPAGSSGSRGPARPTGISPTTASRSTRRSWADLKSHQPFFAQVNFQETHRPLPRTEAGRPRQGGTCRRSTPTTRSPGRTGRIPGCSQRARPQGRADPRAA